MVDVEQDKHRHVGLVAKKGKNQKAGGDNDGEHAADARGAEAAIGPADPHPQSKRGQNLGHEPSNARDRSHGPGGTFHVVGHAEHEAQHAQGNSHAAELLAHTAVEGVLPLRGTCIRRGAGRNDGTGGGKTQKRNQAQERKGTPENRRGRPLKRSRKNLENRGKRNRTADAGYRVTQVEAGIEREPPAIRPGNADTGESCRKADASSRRIRQDARDHKGEGGADVKHAHQALVGLDTERGSLPALGPLRENAEKDDRAGNDEAGI